MYRIMWLCFVLLSTLYCVEANVVNPWNYFNNPGRSGNLQDFNSNTADASRVVPISRTYFPEFSHSFVSRSDKPSWPRIETGFVPSFGNLENTYAVQAQPSNLFGHSIPSQASGHYWGPHRTADAFYYKQATNPVPAYTNKYHQTIKGYPVRGKYSLRNPNKHNINVGSQLSQSRDDPLYHKVKSNVHMNAKRLKKKEKYPNAVNGGIHEPQQNEYFEPQYEQYTPRKKPNCKPKPLQDVINYDKIQQKNRYPLPNHGNVKIYPAAYNPLKSRVDQLKNNQHKTFAEGGNEYPEDKSPEKIQSDEEDILSGGQDIFDKQSEAFDDKKENFNEDFSSHVNRYHPNSKTLAQSTHHDDDEEVNDSESDFVPIKTYAQVRHTETTKHLPREAAYEEAKTFDEVLNAPRLREAIKTSKAQTVYTEEGYEDAAYDHAGHLKHASNHDNYAEYSKDKQDKRNVNEDDNKHSTEDKLKRNYGLSNGVRRPTVESTNKVSHRLKVGDGESQYLDSTSAGSAKLSSSNIDEKKNIFKGVVKDSSYKKDKYVQINPANKIVDFVNNHDGKRNDSYTKEILTKNSNKNKIHPITKQNLQGPIDYNVEVFDTGFTFNKGPKHGGNYHVDPTLLNNKKKWEKLELLERISAKNKKENLETVNVEGQIKTLNNMEYKENVPKAERSKSLPYEYNVTNNHEMKERLQSSVEELEEDKKDQYPVNSEVEVFKSDFITNKNRQKHGGNYRRNKDFKRKSNLYSELEDLESPGKYLHGGNYKVQKMTADVEMKGEESSHEGSSVEEALPTSVVNNIAFLTSNMTVPNYS